MPVYGFSLSALVFRRRWEKWFTVVLRTVKKTAVQLRFFQKFIPILLNNRLYHGISAAERDGKLCIVIYGRKGRWNMQPIIEVKNLRKEYHLGEETVVALKQINLAIGKGEICCIFGTSGSGKSTLLNQLAGMEKPDRGEVKIGGICISRLSEEQLAAFRQRHLGFVFQTYNLLPTMDAVENVAMPLLFRGVGRKEREKAAVSLLERVGLQNRLHHYPDQMSGGQQQRAGIARAFIAHPAVVFADEPTGNLDSKTTTEVMDMIRGFAREYQQTIVMVTHDPQMAAYADRIVTLMDGEIIKDERNVVEEQKR